MQTVRKKKIDGVILKKKKRTSNMLRTLLAFFLTPRAKLNSLSYEWVHVSCAMDGFRTGNHMIASLTP